MRFFLWILEYLNLFSYFILFLYTYYYDGINIDTYKIINVPIDIIITLKFLYLKFDLKARTLYINFPKTFKKNANAFFYILNNKSFKKIKSKCTIYFK